MATNRMATDGTRVPRALTHDEAADLFARTMTLVAGTTGLFALGAYVGHNAPPQLGWLWFVAAFLTLLGIDRAARRSEQLALTLLFTFGALLGLAVAPTIAYYAAADPQTLWQAAGATALFVVGFGAAGYTTRHDLSALARYLFLGLIALVLFGVVAIFVQIPAASLIYAIVGLAIFAGLIAFDFQRLRRSKDIRTAPVLAASIFLDILNVFLLLLSLFGGRDE
jgi:FtsH-binding integral membrane protein